MSYGAPWERGVGTADSMPQRDMEVPGLVPDVGAIGLNTKEARKRRSQRGQRQRRREETALRRERSLVDRDQCFGVIAEAADSHRRELKVISRGLDLCEGTLCCDVASMRTWVTSALEEQQRMMLRVMSEMVRLRNVIEGSRRARGAEGKVVEEGGELSGGYGVQGMDASAVKEGDKGTALGEPASPAEAPSMQAEVCEGSGGSAAGAVGGTPDQPRLSAAPVVHVRGGRWAPPTLAAISERVETAAVVKAAGSASVHTDSVSTVSTVLWESRADVGDWAGSDGDEKVEAAGGAASTIWEETGSEGYEGSSEGCGEEFTARSDGGFEATRPAEAEGSGDVWCAATVTAAAPADMAGTAIFPGDADDIGASEGVNRDSGAVVAPENGQTWTDVGGFDLVKKCIVGGDQGEADREELADRGPKTTGAEMTDTEVPVSEVAPRPDLGRQYVAWVEGRWLVR